MDEDIAKWILEFLLRQRIDDKVVNDILSFLPLSLTNNDNRLKKTLLLRRIESETSNGSVSENVLDLLEIIEELNHREGKTASESMKQAYCAVAVDCTVRFLEENVERNGNYFDAVQRVWRDRVCKVEGLASEESNRWLEEIEAAVWDSDVRGKILMRNTRNEALKAIRVYLKEAWRCLGPTFLELVAEKLGNDVEGLCGGGGGGSGRVEVQGLLANPCRELVPFEENQKGQAPLRRKHVAVKSKRHRGAKISDAESDEENEDESRNKTKRHSGPNVSDIDEAIKDESMNKNAGKKTDSNKTETAVGNQTGSEMKATPEVERVQKALKSSSMELHAAVRDPLPDALQTAQVLSSTMATNKTEPEARAPREATENDTEKKDSDNPAQGNEGQNRNLPRRSSLMEPNGTAHTLEWDDSIENLPGGSPRRPRLPSPKEITKSSPLKNYDDITKFNRRRARKFWTPLEEDTLRTGVHKFGKGNWKLILQCYREIFRERTEVDLKDKWRNLARST